MSTTPERLPVQSSDRVSDVLARDESLVEVFVRHAPSLSKLRNRAMRRVMARLVTVEQAAQVAQIPTDVLVRELNRALGIAVEDAGQTVPAPATAFPRASTPVHPVDARVIELDVRDDLRSGREPFARIMAEVAALDGADVLWLRATFEPVPLFSVLGKRGFEHEGHQDGPDDWSIWFWRQGTPSDSAPGALSADTDARTPAVTAPPPEAAPSEQWLDVRGLEPPEPMMRTLTALEGMPPDRVLVHVNGRVPQFLLPMLTERGFTYTIDETRVDQVLVRIRRTS